MDETPTEYKPDWEHLSSRKMAELSSLTFTYSSLEGNELHSACQSGSIERVVEAVRHGAYVEARTADGESALHIACRQGSLDIVRFLLRIGADANSVDKYLQTPIFKVKVKCQRSFEILTELLQHKAVLTAVDARNYTVLDWACICKDVVKVRELLDAGFDPNSYKRDPSSLHLACISGDVEVVNCLLERGADVNNFSDHWLSPLHGAAYNNHLTVARVLVDHGAELFRQGVAAPLHLASCQGHLAMVEFLLSSGTDPNVVDERGATALHHASCYLRPDVAVVLLKHGANPNAKDNNKFSSLIYLLGHECRSLDDSIFCWHTTCDQKLVQFLTLLLENGLILSPDICTYTTEFLHCETNSSYSRSQLQYNFDSDSESDYDEWNYNLYVATDNGHMAAVQCLLKAGMKFEPNESFMDDEWLVDDIEYNMESIPMVTSWCQWRFLTGIGPPINMILAKIYLGCVDVLGKEAPGDQMEEIRKKMSETKDEFKWLSDFGTMPRPLIFLSSSVIRNHLLTMTKSYNIFPLINQLPLPQTIKDVLKLKHLAPIVEPLSVLQDD